MLKIKPTTKFKKDLKKADKSGWNIDKLTVVIETLVNQKQLDERHYDHKLTGNYIGCRDCHIESDWLLIYRIEDDYLVLLRTGTHSELFK